MLIKEGPGHHVDELSTTAVSDEKDKRPENFFIDELI